MWLVSMVTEAWFWIQFRGFLKLEKVFTQTKGKTDISPPLTQLSFLLHPLSTPFDGNGEKGEQSSFPLFSLFSLSLLCPPEIGRAHVLNSSHL